MYISIKNIQLILLYEILIDDSQKYHLFRKKDFLHNIPLLIDWINVNRYKSIEKLNSDECKIIAGMLCGLNCYQLSKAFDLESSSPEKIESIVKFLPAKFSVKNMTQVIFRLILLNPNICHQTSIENILAIIETLNNSDCKEFYLAT